MILVDTNIVAYLLITGERTEPVQRLARLDGDWRSEAFLLVEFTNVLMRYIVAGRLKPDGAQQLLSRAESLLRERLIAVSHAHALEVAAEHGVTAYDARFLAAARMLGAKLVTEDARLRTAAPALTQSVADALAGT